MKSARTERKRSCIITLRNGQMQIRRDMAVGKPYRQLLIYPLVRRGRILMAQVPQYPEGGLSKKGFGRAYGEKVVLWMEWEKGREALSHQAYGNAWNFPDPTQHNAEQN